MSGGYRGNLSPRITLDTLQYTLTFDDVLDEATSKQSLHRSLDQLSYRLPEQPRLVVSFGSFPRLKMLQTRHS